MRIMSTNDFVSTDEIRTRFSTTVSSMYRREVPPYGTLLDIVSNINNATLDAQPGLRQAFGPGQGRLEIERHGAIRLGTAEELFTIGRMFAVMGMQPVGYYDLSVAGVPVHSTAFRPVADESLANNPFRVFTSLLRLDLLADSDLRTTAERLLSARRIFTRHATELLRRFEQRGGLASDEADEFVLELSKTFRWNGRTTVSADVYQRLHRAHRLLADVVCFRGPHINHLTPRTLDIDAVQAEMPRRGLVPKEVIEGPPRRSVPILLRQTSFRALQEKVLFAGSTAALGTHTARFGEVEQRGMALTRRGRELYDTLLLGAHKTDTPAAAAEDQIGRLKDAFRSFPDDVDSIRRSNLGFFRYSLTPGAEAAASNGIAARSIDELLAQGLVHAEPITYEDFLPVSAAGIFNSNLHDTASEHYDSGPNKSAFEMALGVPVLDELALYELTQTKSIEALNRRLGMTSVL